MVDNLVLFDEDATDFGTLGIGELPDPQSATVHEERNGEFTLTFEYPITGKRFDEIKLGRIVTAPSNHFATHAQPFRIAKITKPLSGIVTVECEHLSYDLSKVGMVPFVAHNVGQAIANITTWAVGDVSGWTFATDKDTQAEFDIGVPRSARATLGGQDGSILDVFGGEYEFDVKSVHLWNARGQNRGVRIEYGKNLIDLNQEAINENVYTHVYPFWQSTEGEYVTPASDPNAALIETGLGGRMRVLTVDVSDLIDVDSDQQPTQAQVRAAGVQYIQAHDMTEPEVSLTVDFADLAKASGYEQIAPLESVRLCDTVTVEFPDLGVDATAKVITTDYDVCAKRYSKIEIGSARSNLAATIADMPKEMTKNLNNRTTALQNAIDSATDALTGISGGHVVIWNHVTHEANNPDEILIMDTDNILTARNVWRYNQAGWGFSSTGYNGPFTLAATMGGGIVADAITAGTLDASIVTIANLARIGNQSAYVDVVQSAIEFYATYGWTLGKIAEYGTNGFKLFGGLGEVGGMSWDIVSNRYRNQRMHIGNAGFFQEEDGRGWRLQTDAFNKWSLPYWASSNRPYIFYGSGWLQYSRFIDAQIGSGTKNMTFKLEAFTVDGKRYYALRETTAMDDGDLPDLPNYD